MKRFIVLIFCFFVHFVAIAQYYVSREFDAAVSKGTRTTTGMPGEKYKCNFCKYTINASFDVDSAIVEGVENVVFYYNGLEPINEIVFNLYRNVYKKGSARIRSVNPNDVFDGVEILSIKHCITTTNKKKLSVFNNGTQAIAYLSSSLKRGENIVLEVRWKTKIASRTKLRGGRYTPNTWFVPYWYPQIAVYDDIYGWNKVLHSGNEEFYMEFANYDVNLTVGNNANVWATGTLLNADKIYTPTILSRLKSVQSSDSVVKIITNYDLGKTLQQSKNTWHFKADSVPDFVFAISDCSKWYASSMIVDKKTNRRVLISSVFRTPRFSAVTEMIRKSINFLSFERPAVPYPYSHMTIFEGSGGMEFPMMVNQDCDIDYSDLFFTTSHEITHTYFPFYLGLNQSCFGFMDEGLTMFVPQQLQKREYAYNDPYSHALQVVKNNSATITDLPVFTPSYSINSLRAFTVASYYKPQVAYSYIEKIVGQQTMDKILKTFVEVWHNKHPHPYDFFNLCQTISGKDLTSFIGNWFFVSGFADLTFGDVVRKDDKYLVTILNKGNLPIEIDLKVVYNAKSNFVENFYFSPDIWNENTKSVELQLDTKGEKIKDIYILSNNSVEINADNNEYHEK